MPRHIDWKPVGVRQHFLLLRSSLSGVRQSSKVDAVPAPAFEQQGSLSPRFFASNRDIFSASDRGGELDFPLGDPCRQVSRRIDSQPHLINVFSLRTTRLK